MIALGSSLREKMRRQPSRRRSVDSVHRRLLVIGGGVVQKVGDDWYVQRRFGSYLEDLSDALGGLVLLATAIHVSVPGVEFSWRVDPTKVQVVPMANPGTGRGMGKRLLWVGRQVRAVWRSVRGRDAVIHIFPAAGGPLGILLLRACSRAYIAYYKSDWPEYCWKARPKQKWQVPYWFLSELLEARLADVLLFRSPAHQRRLQKWAKGRVEPAQPMLATRCTDLGFERGTLGQQIRLLYVGGLYRRKGLDDLMAAFARCRVGLQSKDIRLVVVGGVPAVGGPSSSSASAPDWLLKAIRAAGVEDSVELVGYVDDPLALSEYYQLCHALVVPSRPGAEGFPRVIDEAMSFGMPVIATKVSGIPYTLDGDPGAVLVEPQDVMGLSEAIQMVLADEKEYAKRSLAARRSFERR